MKHKTWLRIAAVLMLLHTIGHTLGTLSWKDAPNAAVAATINAMQTNQFLFMGVKVSIAGFYVGYGITLVFVLLMISIMLWHLAANYQPFMVAVLTVFLLIMATTEVIYFFPLAAALSGLSGICAGICLFIRDENKVQFKTK